ncbi:MAG: hypothetical protein RIG61_04835 [Deltaproteobacteria bacterium]
MKYLVIAGLFFTLLTSCVEVGDSGSNPIQGEVVVRRGLTDSEIEVWIEQAECMESESKSRADIEDLDAIEVPFVDEITIRKELSCGGIPPDNLVACQTQKEIAFLNGLDQDTFLRALRHEEIHFILFFLTGNNDRNHRSIWFDLEESPCPETGL